MSRKCEKHGLNQDLFCLGHNTSVCARCTQSYHFKCPQFVPVEDAAKYAKPLEQYQTGIRREHDSAVATSADILQTVRNEENTFNNYVKAAIESGEENTFTNFLKTTTRSENDRIDEAMKFLTPKTNRQEFQPERIMSYDRTEGDMAGILDDHENMDTEFMRPKSSMLPSPRNSHNSSPLRRSNDPKETPRSPKGTKGLNTNGVGQLLEDVRKFSKGLSSRDDVGMNISLDDLIIKIDRALHEIVENFENTKAQKTSIESQVKEIRHRINKHLDNLENKLLDSLETKFRQMESNVSSTIQRLQKGKADVNNMKSGNIENQNSPFQQNTLLAIRESDKQFRRMKKSINAMTENIYAIDMDVRINQELLEFIGEIQTFGEVSINTRLNPKISDPLEPRRIEVIRTESKRTRPEVVKKVTPTRPVDRSDSKKTRLVNKPKRTVSRRELVETTKRIEHVQPLPEIEIAQHLAFMDEPLPEIVVTSRSGISGIRIMQKKKVKIGHKWTASVTNCKMLPNGRLMFIDSENKRLVVHNKDTYVYRNLKVSDSPRDFAILDSDRVAVTFGTYIEILNILTNRKEKTIQLEFFECNGISYMEGKFYIYGIFDGYLLSRHGVQIMDMYGKVEDRLPITRVQTIHHSIATWKGRIYFTGYSSITCCTTFGDELWVFKHDEMDRPKSLTVDAYGNVFASYENENKIVLISVDGLHSKEFELRKHDLYYGQDPKPISVFFDDIESALIVCNDQKDHSVMYFVKYD